MTSTNALTALYARKCGTDDDPFAWQADGLCAQADPDAFFPETGGSTRIAKQVCTGCPVRVECLTYALENDERFGIWGGLSERDRRRLRHRTAPDAPGAA